MRIAILGNAGSGKSTLARSLAREGVAVLDLDAVAWEPRSGAILRPQQAAAGDLEEFCSSHADWIVEGCYGDLIETILRWKPELIFLNPGKEVCLRNCRNRAWESHKYPSKAEQDANLKTLLRGSPRIIPVAARCPWRVIGRSSTDTMGRNEKCRE